MRLILTILLIGLFKADAQMVINASSPYKSMAVSVCGDTTRLLDSYTGAAAAYSLRKLRAGYTGAAIRVRKDSVGQLEQDIGFDLCGNLDTIALKNFVGLNSGFVTTWYSQGDSTSVNFTQSVAANQPAIVTSGVITRREGKPALPFSPGRMSIASSTQKFAFLHQSGLSSVVWVGSHSTNGQDRAILCNNSGASSQTGFYLSQRTSPSGGLYSAIGRGVGGSYVSVNDFPGNTTQTGDTLQIIYNELDNANATASQRNKLYYNGGSAVTVNIQTGAASASNATSNLFIGITPAGSNIWSGWMSEIIIYKGDKTSSRTGIRDNINTYYGIY